MHTLISLPRKKCARPGIARLSLTLAAGVLLSHCTSPPKSEVVVSVKDQRMGVYHEGVLQKQYNISTSKFGIGDQPNSYRTPLGKHEIVAKIGHGLPPGAVLKSRHWNGEVLKPNAPGRDPIVSRILWLRGMESTNRNAMRRFIYIHGTPEESRLGQPASYGCIRMGMRDVVDVFNDINIGAKVVVTKEHLPHGKKAEKVKTEPEVAPAAAPTPVAPPAATPLAPVQLAAAPQVPASLPAPVKADKGKPAVVASAQTPELAPAPVAEKAGKSFFSFMPRFGKKDAQDDIPLEVTDTARMTQPAAKKPVIRANNEQHMIGPAVPEPIAKGKGKKDRVEKVSSADKAFTRLLGFHSGN